MNPRIYYLKNELLKNLKHKWTIEEMADKINVSESYLHQLFRKNMETSPMAFLHDVRLEKARELLETTWDTMRQIRYAVGMPDDSHFTRDFKKKYGTTPTQYQKQYWDEIQDEENFCEE